MILEPVRRLYLKIEAKFKSNKVCKSQKKACLIFYRRKKKQFWLKCLKILKTPKQFPSSSRNLIKFKPLKRLCSPQLSTKKSKCLYKTSQFFNNKTSMDLLSQERIIFWEISQ